ncbi:MAG TPA: hypothetical protein VNL14_09765 [Candidatus Acidoferrales bacterium]|nr:hypothetical protein [Candidatus Acidoferrales bacterium]
MALRKLRLRMARRVATVQDPFATMSLFFGSRKNRRAHAAPRFSL